jgi:preprotein translocase subunit YajC
MGDSAGALLPLVILAGAFVVLVVLPMRNRSRQLAATRQMQAGIAVDSDVMTTSGLYARVVGIDDDTVDLEVAPGVVVRWNRAAIAEIRTTTRSAGPTADDGEPGPG